MNSLKNMFCVLTSILVISAASGLQAQGSNYPGQIISAQQADLTFGPVLQSFSFNKKMLLNITRNFSDVLLFNLIDGQLVVLDRHRNPVHPRNFTVSPDQEFHVFDIRKVNLLMNLTGIKTMTIELRNNGILTITTKNAITGNNKSGTEADGYTLEYSNICPPYCLD